MRSTFPSKRDAWISLLIWGGALGMVYGGYEIYTQAGPGPAHLLLMIALVVLAGFMLWLLYGTSYTLTETDIVIRCGPFRFRVPLQEIDSVMPSRNPLSSPACSLDRLMIRWRNEGRRVLISPESKESFMGALQRRCAQLSRSGNGLSRNAATSIDETHSKNTA